MGITELIEKALREEGWKEGSKVGWNEGWKKGWKDGWKEGWREGQQEGLALAITALLKKHYSITQTAEMLSVSLETVESVKEDLDSRNKLKIA